MSTDEYAPSDEEMLSAYVTGRMMRDGLMRTEAEQEFRCGLARVRRDAAREALDGYADALNQNRHAAVWGWHDFVHDVREWASSNYPEESP